MSRIVIPKEIRRILRIREGDPSHTTLTPFDKFSWAIHSVVERYIESEVNFTSLSIYPSRLFNKFVLSVCNISIVILF